MAMEVAVLVSGAANPGGGPSSGNRLCVRLGVGRATVKMRRSDPVMGDFCFSLSSFDRYISKMQNVPTDLTDCSDALTWCPCGNDHVIHSNAEMEF